MGRYSSAACSPNTFSEFDNPDMSWRLTAAHTHLDLCQVLITEQINLDLISPSHHCSILIIKCGCAPCRTRGPDYGVKLDEGLPQTREVAESSRGEIRAL